MYQYIELARTEYPSDTGFIYQDYRQNADQMGDI